MAYTFLPETCFLVILSVSVVLANLPVPKNVRVISINMGVILEWDRPNTSLGNLTYTAEYRSSDDAGFSTVCRNQTERRCDFTQGIHPFGIYVFQVRAERRGETSRWAKTKEFLPDQETVIGGPTVRLVSREGNLEMDIQDPVMKVKDLIEIYSTVGYNIRYWKEGEEDKATVMNDRQQNSLVLIQLEALSRYCVQVQVFIGEFEKTGEFSQATCETTTTDVVLANLPVPKNVRVISINMGVILEWDRPNTSLGNLTYTAEYRCSVGLRGCFQSNAGNCCYQPEPCDAVIGGPAETWRWTFKTLL
ncbi:interleukin-10 receptor subunit beta-like isoform X3 [Anguilla anguilla]|uniref:interleukin-10 receptor subunit beta-like isoform X3 n=1 Tax=Anguilla anguilla TaxID=7936 RepID=UPI0015ABCEFF|nr:interleukin-10 receptor subunit beta-like isoform X3 [Anguilla anguilla]